MTTRALMAVALLASAGCSDDGPLRERGVNPDRAERAPGPRRRLGGRANMVGSISDLPDKRAPLVLSDGTQPPRQPTTSETAMETPPARDLGAELRGLAGSPATCFTGDLGTLPEMITIRVTATVTVQGIITRATASGAGVPADAAQCIRQRVEGGRMRAPVEGAPRSVSTEIVLRREARPEEDE